MNKRQVALAVVQLVLIFISWTTYPGDAFPVIVALFVVGNLLTIADGVTTLVKLKEAEVARER